MDHLRKTKRHDPTHKRQDARDDDHNDSSHSDDEKRSAVVPGIRTRRGTRRRHRDPDSDLDRPARLKKYVRKDELFVDWNRVAVGRAGQEGLMRYLPIGELDALIGWATHMDRSNSAMEQHQHEQLLQQQEQQQHEDAPALSILTTNDSHRYPNPLIGLVSEPLRPSLISWLSELATTTLFEIKEERLWESFDVSALVSLGMALEEIITALFLPLAELHVRRCRQLQENDDINAAPNEPGQSGNDNSDSGEIFNTRHQSSEPTIRNEWTLPPEEALMALLRLSDLQLGRRSGLATASTNITRLDQSIQGTNNKGENRDESCTRLLIGSNWIRSQGFPDQGQFVENNWDTLRLFFDSSNQEDVSSDS